MKGIGGIIYLMIGNILYGNAQIILRRDLVSPDYGRWRHEFQIQERRYGDTIVLHGEAALTNSNTLKLAIIKGPIRVFVSNPGSYNDSSGAMRVALISSPSTMDTTIEYYGTLKGPFFFLYQLGIDTTISESLIHYTKGDTISFQSGTYLLKYFAAAPYGNPTLILLPASPTGIEESQINRFDIDPRLETNGIIEIYDISGRLVSNGKGISSLSKGVYFCKIRLDLNEGKKHSYNRIIKFIKLR